MLNVGFDLDGCVFDTDRPIIDLVNIHYGTNISYDKEEYDLENIIEEATAEEVWKIVLTVISMNKLPIKENAGEVISYISMLVDKIFFITHRPKKIVHATVNQLSELGLSCKHELIMVDKGVENIDPDKHSAIINNKIRIFVEDKPSTIQNIYSNTRKTTILVFDNPWNRHIEDNHRIKRVMNWLDVGKFVKEYTSG